MTFILKHWKIIDLLVTLALLVLLVQFTRDWRILAIVFVFSLWQYFDGRMTGLISELKEKYGDLP